MILPHPETDFSINILVVATDIISELKKQKKPILVEKAMQTFLSKDIKRTPDLFIKSLTFLYCVGLIQHDKFKIKLIKRNKPKQTNLFEPI